ncbi:MULTISPECIES: LptF/LptG family permease [unclassified Aureimonas]|uniref:LptF/LptG family permease n=1 Tax=unclassified Aureimonas TaxID=2615206 RepID=UPI0006FCB1E7|nr:MULTISPECIES: LptF/LptG family permease [unclassified Aureimonas]KQT52931.1 permease [Aureimonas sp. Leaf427]KQT80390.1 permease [Aureimonas sp. Leaf460]
MSLLERYIFRRAFGFAVGSLGSLVVIVWVVQALQRVDIVRTSMSAAGNIFWIALMLLPDLAAGVLPFAVLIGSIQALNALNADSERAVMSAAGASGRVVLKPILAIGLLAAVLSLFNSHVLGPAAQRSFHDGLRSINADALTLFLQPGRFEEVQNGLVMSVSAVHGSTIEGLFLSDSRDPSADLTYFAKEARLVDEDAQSLLLLYDGQLHRRTNDDGAISIIQFQTYAFDLATLKPKNDGDWIRTSERPTLELLNPDPNDESYQKKPENFTRELAQRFSDWLYPIAFALWAVAVAAHPRTNRQGPGPAMLLGISGALFLKALGFVVLSLIERDARLQVLAYALPLLSISASLALIRFDVPVSQLPVIDRISDGMAAITRAIGRLGPQAEAGGGRRR